MVNAMRSEEESEMADIIESLGTPRALTIADIIGRARSLGNHAFVDFLQERKNARIVSIRLEDCDYRRFNNKHEKQGRWRIGSQRTGVYVLKQMTEREGYEAVKQLHDLNE